MLNFNKKKKDVIYIPIGRGCHTAMHLNLLGLRKCSYPMDWIIPSDKNEVMETRFEYLMGNFKYFLEKKHLEVKQVSEIREHALVYNHYSDFTFGHDFSYDISIDKTFQKVKKKYNRRCKRLVSDIKQAREVRLIYMQNTWDHINEMDTSIKNSLFKTLMYRLGSKYPDTKFNLYIFEHNDNIEYEKYEKIQIDKNIYKFISNHLYTKNNEKLNITISIEKIFKKEIQKD